MNRKIVIIHENEECAQNVHNMVSILMTNVSAHNITVYVRTPFAMSFNIAHERTLCTTEIIPAECDTEPKTRNWILDKERGTCDFLHVISDNVELLKNPNAFISDIEKTMTALDYPIWLSTVTDSCNYVYSKYNPRMRVVLDRPDVCEKLGLSGELCFTSHSNTQWMIYDMPHIANSDMRFDERFTVPMFFIIDLLARLRNRKPAGSLRFMNNYLTVGSEYDVFRNLPNASKKPDDQKKLAEEDATFKQSGINFAPDNNMDLLLDTLWEKIKIKASI